MNKNCSQSASLLRSLVSPAFGLSKYSLVYSYHPFCHRGQRGFTELQNTLFFLISNKFISTRAWISATLFLFYKQHIYKHVSLSFPKKLSTLLSTPSASICPEATKIANLSQKTILIFHGNPNFENCFFFMHISFDNPFLVIMKLIYYQGM